MYSACTLHDVARTYSILLQWSPPYNDPPSVWPTWVVIGAIRGGVVNLYNDPAPPSITTPLGAVHYSTYVRTLYTVHHAAVHTYAYVRTLTEVT